MDNTDQLISAVQRDGARPRGHVRAGAQAERAEGGGRGRGRGGEQRGGGGGGGGRGARHHHQPGGGAPAAEVQQDRQQQGQEAVPRLQEQRPQGLHHPAREPLQRGGHR